MREDAELLLLDEPTVQAVLDPDEVIAAVRQAFCFHSQSAARVFPVIREKLHTGLSFGINAGDVASLDLLGFKATGFSTLNRQIFGVPHQATIVLLDPKTGRPQCVMNGNAIANERMGAAGALGLMQLARADSTKLCVFGTGVQARVQVSYALHVLPEIKQVQYVSFDGEESPEFEAHFSGKCEIRVARDCNAVVSESDVVITATTGAEPLFDANAVRAGTHFNCFGTDTIGKRVLPLGLLERAWVVVDDEAQSRSFGEVQGDPSMPVIELGQLLTGKVSLMRAYESVSVFHMTGVALQDMTVARCLFERAKRGGLGTEISWPW